jgi:creatinine amidohydrolase/Fe(II)-dependent formamide hydrolase-like protein
VGNPKKATREKGEKYFRYVVGEIAEMFREVAKTSREEAYI